MQDGTDARFTLHPFCSFPSRIGMRTEWSACSGLDQSGQAKHTWAATATARVEETEGGRGGEEEIDWAWAVGQLQYT